MSEMVSGAVGAMMVAATWGYWKELDTGNDPSPARSIVGVGAVGVGWYLVVEIWRALL